MSLIAKEDISISRKDVKESRNSSLNTTKTLIFKHEASAGDMLIDTTALVTPADALANGFVQPSLAEVASVNLLVNKNNVKIHSSRGVWLQMHDDYKIVGASKIQFIGNLELLGGALEGEVFTIYAAPIQATSILTTDHKKQYEEYVLAEGETVLNLGREYEVNRNPLRQIGAIRIFRNAQGPQLRNVGNAAAAPLADGNFHENDAGNGIGTSIEFNVAPSGQDDVIVVEFGLEYAGDFSLVGDIESLYGAILKLAEDTKDLGPFLISRYITANPSQVERRAFGDQVLELQSELARINNRPHAVLFKTGAFSLVADENIISFAGIDKANKITVSGTDVTFEETGVYRMSVNYRSVTDVWTKWYVEDAAGNLKGDGSWGGSGINYTPHRELLFEVTAPGIHKFILWLDLADSVQTPTFAGTPDGNLTRTLYVVISKIRDL